MPEGNTILFIDADARRSELAGSVFRFVGERVEHALAVSAASPRGHAMAMLAADGDPVELAAAVETLRANDPALPIVLLQAPESLDAEALGCVAGIGWPLRQDELLSALYLSRVYREQREPSRERGVAGARLFRALVGQSAGLQAVRRMMGQVADTEATVLVLGESGTGKEVVARSLHEHSRRRAGPFVPVNCGAIPADLLESELFGHEKGAFTGAVTARAGRFELARGGTLFLDEIGDMPLTMQVKLLRVIQERRFERVGGSQTLEADVRIVCATHKDLEQMIAKGTFREDLFYRINVFPIELPPLRERAEDLPLLVSELTQRLEKEERGSVRFAPSALASLQRHPWAGNVRELANLVERMAIMHPGAVVGARDLPLKFRHLEEGEEDLPEPPPPVPVPSPGAGAVNPGSDLALLPVNGLDLKEFIQDLEQSLIQQALDDCGGVVARAAERLRLRRTTLVEKMRKYGMMTRQDESED